ncbi:MAG: hypothetical protein ACFE7E_02360 [Candidatus Hodarchaeota archaeon]
MQIDLGLVVTFLTIISIALAITVSVIRIFYYRERMESLDKTEDTEAVTIREAPILKNYKCPLCKGDGLYQGKKCKACEGVGMFKAPQDSVVCGTCGGTGTYQGKKKCKICKGRGRVPSYPISAVYDEYEIDD